MKRTDNDSLALRDVLGSKLDTSVSLTHMSFESSAFPLHRLRAEDETTYCFQLILVDTLITERPQVIPVERRLTGTRATAEKYQIRRTVLAEGYRS